MTKNPNPNPCGEIALPFSKAEHNYKYFIRNLKDTTIDHKIKLSELINLANRYEFNYKEKQFLFSLYHKNITKHDNVKELINSINEDYEKLYNKLEYFKFVMNSYEDSPCSNEELLTLHNNVLEIENKLKEFDNIKNIVNIILESI